MSSMDAANNTPDNSPIQAARATSKWKRRLGVTAGAITVVGVCLAVRSLRGPAPADAKGPPTDVPTKSTAPIATQPKQLQIVAQVNGDTIGRQELAQECLAHYGSEVLEAMLNKYLIIQYCHQRNIAVTRKEVSDEIDRLAKKFGISTDQWIKMIQEERHISAQQYADDIVWPMLALKKVASDQIQPTQQEIESAYESKYGEAVKTRLIVVATEQLANQVLAQARSQPDTFPVLAKKWSIDPSASANGLIQPIHHHVGDPQVEETVFRLRDGEVSPIVKVGNQFLIFKSEGHLPAVQANINEVKDQLAELVRDSKLRKVGSDTFKALQKQAVVQNFYGDPEKSRQMPGIAAIINDRQITLRELSEECIDRHGIEVLEGTINRHLLEQALRAKKITITQPDIDAEIARAAVAMGKTTTDNKPDVNAWIDMVTKEQHITYDLYVRDAVWPSVALKKLCGTIDVTDEDMHRGFEANYGSRVKCRVIVLGNLRKAQEVFSIAQQELNKHPDRSGEFFGRLAEQYSIDPSRSVQGRVPPIQKWGGVKALEDEAFRLQAGQLSGIIQVNDSYVILLSEGFTETEKVSLTDATVKRELYDDIHEKKQRIAMAEAFTHLKDAAQIDNLLAGTVQAPKRSSAAANRAGNGSPAEGQASTAGVYDHVVPASANQPVGSAPSGSR
jgi:parvulin-like peptidyl-prolyl isomerase